MGIAAGAEGVAVGPPEGLSACRVAKQGGAGVERLRDIDLTGYCPQCILIQPVVPKPVKRVGHRHQAALVPDPVNRREGAQSLGHLLLQEEAEDLASIGLNLLADNDLEGSDLLHRERSLDIVVVRNGQARDVLLERPLDQHFRRHCAVP